jgi:hypothetical protein
MIKILDQSSIPKSEAMQRRALKARRSETLGIEYAIVKPCRSDAGFLCRPCRAFCLSNCGPGQKATSAIFNFYRGIPENKPERSNPTRSISELRSGQGLSCTGSIKSFTSSLTRIVTFSIEPFRIGSVGGYRKGNIPRRLRF